MPRQTIHQASQIKTLAPNADQAGTPRPGRHGLGLGPADGNGADGRCERIARTAIDVSSIERKRKLSTDLTQQKVVLGECVQHQIVRIYIVYF